MKKHHVKKEPEMKVCRKCAWKGMKYKTVCVYNRCDMCGKLNGLIYNVRACNLQ